MIDEVVSVHTNLPRVKYRNITLASKSSVGNATARGSVHLRKMLTPVPGSDVLVCCLDALIFKAVPSLSRPIELARLWLKDPVKISLAPTVSLLRL